jgi:undecaprenyl-diphosphatase
MQLKGIGPCLLFFTLCTALSTHAQQRTPEVGVYVVGAGVMALAFSYEQSGSPGPMPSPFLERWVEPLAVKGSVGLAGAWWVWAKIDRDSERLAVSEALIRSVAYSGLSTLALKAVFRRTRPGTEPQQWFAYDQAFDLSDSFPSGHSAVAVSTATTLVLSYPEERWLPWVAFPLAGLACWERLANDQHHPGDVVAGALLGYTTGVLATRPISLDRIGARVYWMPEGLGLVWELEGRDSPADIDL